MDFGLEYALVGKSDRSDVRLRPRTRKNSPRHFRHARGDEAGFTGGSPVTAVPRRILCADDNVHVLSMLTATFQAKGFAVETAVDGAQALTQIEADPSRFDLLITDSRMPRVDGFGLVGAARGAGYQGRIVVFASGLAP